MRYLIRYHWLFAIDLQISMDSIFKFQLTLIRAGVHFLVHHSIIRTKHKEDPVWYQCSISPFHAHSIVGLIYTHFITRLCYNILKLVGIGSKLLYHRWPSYSNRSFWFLGLLLLRVLRMLFFCPSTLLTIIILFFTYFRKIQFISHSNAYDPAFGPLRGISVRIIYSTVRMSLCLYVVLELTTTAPYFPAQLIIISF